MIPGAKSPYYEKMKCSGCSAIIMRRKGVTNPLCDACNRKKNREREQKKRREVVHISKRA